MSQPQENNIIIIGAGASGIIMGCQLQRKLHFTDFEIYDRSSEFSGTWYYNTYPGCGCDVPSHFYSFSFAKKADWSWVYPQQPEIKQYMIDVARQYNLYLYTHFHTECLGAEWNKDVERWTVHFKSLETKETFSKSCKFLVLAVGILSVPNPCPIPGIENFKGEAWHSAMWNHKVGMENKNVIVIGNGCSASQIVPAILPKVKTLSQFMRSPNWILERSNYQYSNTFKWVMKNIPGANSLYRFLWATYFDTCYIMFRTKSGKWLRDLVARSTEKYMKSQSPKKYHNILIPKYEMGAKRRVFDTRYLKCLHDPKIFLTDDLLIEIKEYSVVTKSGKEYPADVIVYANGFQAHEFTAPMNIKGKSGENLRAQWKRQGGARAYMGLMVADFPNMFIMVGPNTASTHFSVLFMAECNAKQIMKIIEPFLGTASKGSVEVKEEAERKDVEWVQNRLKGQIWGQGRESGWYIDKRTGHNGIIYPHFQSHYWLRTLRIKWSDFDIQRPKKKGNIGIDFLAIIIFIVIVSSWLMTIHIM